MNKSRKEFLKNVFYDFNLVFNDEYRTINFSKQNVFNWVYSKNYSYDLFYNFPLNKYVDIVNNDYIHS